jgi:hypothetical protein
LSAHVVVAAGVAAPVRDGEAEVGGVVPLVDEADVVAEAGDVVAEAVGAGVEAVGAGVDDRAATATTTVAAVRRMARAPAMTPIRCGARRLDETCSPGSGSSIRSRGGEVMLRSPGWWGGVDHLSGWFQ